MDMKIEKQRYVIMQGQVFRREDKDPFPSSGKSIKGALEYNPAAETVRCHECGEWFQSVGCHVGFHAGMTARDYRNRHGLRAVTPLCAPLLSEHRRNSPTLPFKDVSIRLRADAAKTRATALAREMGAPRNSPQTAEQKNVKGYCPVQIPDTIRKLADELGHCPTRRDVTPQFYDAALTLHGSWAEACFSAGIDPSRIVGVNYSKERLLDMLIDFYALNHRLPYTREFGRLKLPAYNTFAKYFGSMGNAFEAAGLGLVHRGVA
jgi:hypothetical protein